MILEEEDRRIDAAMADTGRFADEALLELEKAAAAHRSTRDALTVAVLQARSQGLALRTIAEAAAMSHETVRRIVAQ